MEEEKQVQNNEPLTKKEKADIAGRDVAEVAARGAGRYYGGEVGGAVVDAALQTKAGQKIIGKASKVINRNPVTRNLLAKNQETISEVKPMVNSMIDQTGGASGEGSANGNGSTGGTPNNDADILNKKNSFRNNENDDISDSDSDSSDNKINIMKDGVSGAFKKAPLKVKLIIIGILVSFVFNLLLVVSIIAPFMELGVIDIEGVGGPSTGPSYGYTSIPSSASFWWPMGSSAVTSSGGRQFASGKPPWTTITSKFGPRVHPITGEVNSFHTGVDIVASGGAGVPNIIASRSGKVTYPSSNDPVNCPTSKSLDGCGGGYGNFVIIDHGDGSSTLYAHLHQMTITVSAGDYVSQGQVIGKMGSSGNSTGPHLHFEVRFNGSAVEPLNYVSMNNPRPK